VPATVITGYNAPAIMITERGAAMIRVDAAGSGRRLD
jgi:hypothetical protein